MADKQPPPLMGATAIRPPDRVGAEKYTYLLYDPKNGTILTRTPKSWGLIILFYCIYYSCLAAFWLACMKIFLTIQIQDPSALDTAKPTWTEGASIIGVRPGIGIRPVQTYEEVDSGIFDLDWVAIPGSDATAQQNLDDEYKKFKEDHGIEDKDNKWMMENMLMSKDYAGSKGYAYRAFQFFKVYRDNVAQNNGEDFDSCAADTEGYRKDLKSFCRFKQSTLGSCQSFPYGYSKDAFNPCIFVKMNRIMDLKPRPITDSKAQDDSVKDDPTGKVVLDILDQNSYPKDSVYIMCEGLMPADKESVKIEVFPKSGLPNAPIGLGKIPLKYFPYSQYRKDADGRGANEAPMIAVQVADLQKANGRLIHVMCKAFFDGVVHSKKDKAGLVQFEVFLNDKNAS
jgi:hypothetical protein